MNDSAGARDPYTVLGVKRNSTDREVRAAYLSKVKKYHPDANDGWGDEKALNEAKNAFDAIMSERADVQAEKVRECKHCNGTMLCSCPSCTFVIVFKRNFFSGQCAVCA